ASRRTRLASSTVVCPTPISRAATVADFPNSPFWGDLGFVGVFGDFRFGLPRGRLRILATTIAFCDCVRWRRLMFLETIKSIGSPSPLRSTYRGSTLTVLHAL